MITWSVSLMLKTIIWLTADRVQHEAVILPILMILLKEKCFKDRISREPRKRIEEQVELILNPVPSKREGPPPGQRDNSGTWRNQLIMRLGYFMWLSQSLFEICKISPSSVLTFFLQPSLTFIFLSLERYVPHYKWGNRKVLVSLVSLVRVTQQPKAKSAAVTLIKEFGNQHTAIWWVSFWVFVNLPSVRHCSVTSSHSHKHSPVTVG